MKREVQKIEEIRVVSVSGTIPSYEALIDFEIFVAWLEAGERRFIFDLSRLAHLGSASLGVALQCQKAAKAAEATLRLVASEPQRKILQITALDQVFLVHTTLDEAVAAFAQNSDN
jgi:anti-sigma B factor antagonist